MPRRGTDRPGDQIREPMKRRDGFTLIEVMGAMVLFTGGVLMVMNLATSLSTQLQRSGMITELSSLVREQVDSLEAEGYDGLTVSSTTASLTVRGVSYTLSRAVTNYSPLVRQITVTLEPTSGTGPNRGYTTYVVTPW